MAYWVADRAGGLLETRLYSTQHTPVIRPASEGAAGAGWHTSGVDVCMMDVHTHRADRPDLLIWQKKGKGTVHYR